LTAPAASPALGVGIDIVEIARVERALARRPRLAERLFTEAERAYAAERARPARHLAARFCAKEAVAKALALRAWSPREIEVVSGNAAPAVRLTGRTAERAGERAESLQISLTHSRELAAAVVLASLRPTDT
jgi:holo-[acyl-carrier protein] synthase